MTRNEFVRHPLWRAFVDMATTLSRIRVHVEHAHDETYEMSDKDVVITTEAYSQTPKRVVWRLEDAQSMLTTLERRIELLQRNIDGYKDDIVTDKWDELRIKLVDRGPVEGTIWAMMEDRFLAGKNDRRGFASIANELMDWSCTVAVQIDDVIATAKRQQQWEPVLEEGFARLFRMLNCMQGEAMAMSLILIELWKYRQLAGGANERDVPAASGAD